MYVLFLFLFIFVYLILNLIICTNRADTYVLNALCALLSFELFFGRYHSFLSVAYRWRNIVLAIKIWIKVCIFYSCSLVMPYDGLPYYLIFRKWLGPSDLFNRINIITSVSRRLNEKFRRFFWGEGLFCFVFLFFCFLFFFGGFGFFLSYRCSPGYVCALAFKSHVENTCMTAKCREYFLIFIAL